MGELAPGFFEGGRVAGDQTQARTFGGERMGDG